MSFGFIWGVAPLNYILRSFNTGKWSPPKRHLFCVHFCSPPPPPISPGNAPPHTKLQSVVVKRCLPGTACIWAEKLIKLKSTTFGKIPFCCNPAASRFTGIHGVFFTNYRSFWIFENKGDWNGMLKKIKIEKFGCSSWIRFSETLFFSQNQPVKPIGFVLFSCFNRNPSDRGSWCTPQNRKSTICGAQSSNWPRILQSKINIQQEYTKVFDMLLKMNVNSQHIVEGWLLFLSIFIIMIDFERVWNLKWGHAVLPMQTTEVNIESHSTFFWMNI